MFTLQLEIAAEPGYSTELIQKLSKAACCCITHGRHFILPFNFCSRNMHIHNKSEGYQSQYFNDDCLCNETAATCTTEVLVMQNLSQEGWGFWVQNSRKSENSNPIFIFLNQTPFQTSSIRLLFPFFIAYLQIIGCQC